MILGRWAEYFDELLNANISDQSKDIGMVSMFSPKILTSSA
jgi:hypothetical protein